MAKDKEEVLTETDDELEVVEVDAAPGEEVQAAETAVKDEEKPKEADSDEDEHDEDVDEEHDEEDTRLGDREEDSEEDNKERRKRLNRRKRLKESRDRMSRELEFLRSKVVQLEAGQNQLHTTQLSATEAQLDNRLAEVRRDIATADAILAQAIKDADGDSYATAMRLRDEAKEQEREIATAKANIKPREADAPNPNVARLVNAWRSDNPWYVPRGSDYSSRVVDAIDAGLMAEGHDPSSERYFQELSRRVENQFQKDREKNERRNGMDREESPRRKAPPLGASRDGNGQSSKRQVYLSKERVDAIKAAGAWDDPKERATFIKAYEEYDREHAAQR